MPHPDLRRTLVAPLLAAAVVGAVLTGCGGQGSGTSCGVDGCTVTFARSGAAEVSVLGVTARLVREGRADRAGGGAALRQPAGARAEPVPPAAR